MELTQTETEKLVSILNYVVESLGYEAEQDGFGYDESFQISALSGNDMDSFEEGLDFLLHEIGNI